MKNLIALTMILGLSTCLNADEIPVPPAAVTTDVAQLPAPAEAPEPQTIEDRVQALERALATFLEADYRLKARMDRVENHLNLTPVDHRHEWRATTPTTIVRDGTVSAVCRCGAFGFVPFSIQSEEEGQ